MKKLIAGAVVILAAGTGLAYALMPSGPTHQQVEDAIAGTGNVQEVVSSSWDHDKLMVLVSWKDLTKGQSAAEQLCLFFPQVSSIHWDNKAGEQHRYQCK
ncbi:MULTISPECIES: hypothetical protein [unclassified Mesorhizobium]|uniref:hypothetical protein n=1 Tax=unclassified Mesorhizobium TaxID=325217 RepID=UPI00112D94EA|nr:MULTISPECIES: hypothetical protein [unclassified Mesorhizobium]TPJ51652.1 hypothetical protein FJ426_20685 [Mesorhizobium sp. B2-6-4]TPN42330.1 hypothetical protein FJ979_01965 [Mesorhizobium sp. B1-1-6]